MIDYNFVLFGFRRSCQRQNQNGGYTYRIRKTHFFFSLDSQAPLPELPEVRKQRRRYEMFLFQISGLERDNTLPFG
jgi:hypothetical protein